MGRNKNQQKRFQKSRAVFKVAGNKNLKAKVKAKPVTTNLKKMNVKAKEEIQNCDKKLNDIRNLISAKSEKTKENSEKSASIADKQQSEYVDMDEAANEFQKL